MKRKLSIPIETIRMLPYDRPYSEAEAMIQVIFDIETQTDYSEQGYAKQFDWSRTKVHAFLERNKLFERLKRQPQPTYQKPLKERKNTFGLSLKPYLMNGEIKPGTYTRQQLKDFYQYWTEVSQKNGKLKFENQDYFDIPKRLATAKKFIWDKGYSVDDNVSSQADELIKYCKSYAVGDHNKLVSMIKNSKKSDDIKKYALKKLQG